MPSALLVKEGWLTTTPRLLIDGELELVIALLESLKLAS